MTRSFEAIRDNYRLYTEAGRVPELLDRGVDKNVFRRITPEQFRTFWGLATAAAEAARAALDAETPGESVTRWRELLGDEFPPADEPFTPPASPAKATSGRFG